MHAAYHTSVTPKYKKNLIPFTQVLKYTPLSESLLFFLNLHTQYRQNDKSSHMPLKTKTKKKKRKKVFSCQRRSLKSSVASRPHQ